MSVPSSSQNTDKVSFWELRTQEQDYALLDKVEAKDSNCYGQKIDLVELSGLPENRSMHINENPEVGDNSNRNKQHGFFFSADDCIGCHACEAACSEKNDNPAHIAFRSVGYVEGGSYPDLKRMNISMACNHCDDPVCLKGCPTGAYTKHAEYGAVLQDPDTCFGCGYCTWVCPYNAPQLDPVKGEVSKCNMCVDRLEVGLKPACVTACVGNALDFGIIENIPENREQAKTSIPGFPDPEITQPNIRFQQTSTLPDEMHRTDSAPIKYRRDANGEYKPSIDKTKCDNDKAWNFSRLYSHENPLVLFTLLSQMSIGAFLLVFVGVSAQLPGLIDFQTSVAYVPLMMICLCLCAFGLFMSTMHLGKPMRFYRGFNNLRHSPVCREGLGIALFLTFIGLHGLFALPSSIWFQELLPVSLSFSESSLLDSLGLFTGILALISALLGLYYMNRCYRIKARPFWDHWQVATSFFGNMFSLGSILGATAVLINDGLVGNDYSQTLAFFSCTLIFGLCLEAIGLAIHARDMSNADHEGAASYYIQLTTFGKTYLLRNLMLCTTIIIPLVLLIISTTDFFVWSLVACGVIFHSIISRALFYVLVIPTTMPGAFFWKNKKFEEHAKDIGLAKLPQVGIIP
ncbi:MAG: aspartate carbamoyltransferase [SAR86 cluster bacterium]|uniref:Aspartate carbamoyltransferase n=1 Tax=SAR86 cluster bacterium TaxID=2030880 RepID=A0A2A4MQS2_9GAMM|nr:MAG: aspartate carbamoyltransferase [SAR86 cluster bacterium]